MGQWRRRCHGCALGPLLALLVLAVAFSAHQVMATDSVVQDSSIKVDRDNSDAPQPIPEQTNPTTGLGVEQDGGPPATPHTSGSTGEPASADKATPDSTLEESLSAEPAESSAAESRNVQEVHKDDSVSSVSHTGAADESAGAADESASPPTNSSTQSDGNRDGVSSEDSTKDSATTGETATEEVTVAQSDVEVSGSPSDDKAEQLEQSDVPVSSDSTASGDNATDAKQDSGSDSSSSDTEELEQPVVTSDSASSGDNAEDGKQQDEEQVSSDASGDSATSSDDVDTEETQESGTEVALDKIEEVVKPDDVFNYASASAGAKILGTSPAMRSAHTLLDGDEDKYMMAPCEQRKWFIVQLSEDIVLNRVSIGNLEHYSSSIKDFQLLGSDSFPTNQWMLLGNFRAQNVHHRQVFQLDKEVHVRYLKFRLLSHYGSEYYCTMTFVKAFGSTMLESFRKDMEESSKEVDEVQRAIRTDIEKRQVEEEIHDQEIHDQAQTEAQAQAEELQAKDAEQPDSEQQQDPQQELEQEQEREQEQEQEQKQEQQQQQQQQQQQEQEQQQEQQQERQQEQEEQQQQQQQDQDQDAPQDGDAEAPVSDSGSSPQSDGGTAYVGNTDAKETDSTESSPSSTAPEKDSVDEPAKDVKPAELTEPNLNSGRHGTAQRHPESAHQDDDSVQHKGDTDTPVIPVAATASGSTSSDEPKEATRIELPNSAETQSKSAEEQQQNEPVPPLTATKASNEKVVEPAQSNDRTSTNQSALPASEIPEIATRGTEQDGTTKDGTRTAAATAEGSEAASASTHSVKDSTNTASGSATDTAESTAAGEHTSTSETESENSQLADKAMERAQSAQGVDGTDAVQPQSGGSKAPKKDNDAGSPGRNILDAVSAMGRALGIGGGDEAADSGSGEQQQKRVEVPSVPARDSDSLIENGGSSAGTGTAVESNMATPSPDVGKAQPLESAVDNTEDKNADEPAPSTQTDPTAAKGSSSKAKAKLEQSGVNTEPPKETAEAGQKTGSATPAETETNKNGTSCKRSKETTNSSAVNSSKPIGGPKLRTGGEVNGTAGSHGNRTAGKGSKKSREGKPRAGLGSGAWNAFKAAKNKTEAGAAAVSKAGAASSSIFQALTHRIKVLEINQSLSNHYIEDATRRFSKAFQNVDADLEEIRTSHQKELNALKVELVDAIDTMNSSSTRTIEELQKQLRQLSMQVQTLQNTAWNAEVMLFMIASLVLLWTVNAVAAALCSRGASASGKAPTGA